jgi:hypothetical protein
MARNKGRRPGVPTKSSPTADKAAPDKATPDKPTPDKLAAEKAAAQPAAEPRGAAGSEKRSNGAGGVAERAVSPSASTPSGATAQPTGEARTERARPGEPATPLPAGAGRAAAASGPPLAPRRPGGPESGGPPPSPESPKVPPSAGPTKPPPAAAAPDRPAPREGAPITPPPQSGGSRGLVGGLIGGLIAGAAAFFALQAFGPSGEIEALRLRVEQLGEAVNGVEGRTVELDELTARVGELEGGGGLAERVAALETSIEQAPAGAGAEIAELRAQIGTLAQSVADAESAPAPGVPQEVADRLDSLESRIAQLADGQGRAATGGADLSGLRQQMADLQTKVGEVAAVGDLAGRMDAGQERIAAVGNQLEGLETELSAQRQRTESLLGEVQGLKERLDGTESRLASLDDVRERAAALALVSGQLAEAMGRAEPFEGTLERLSALGGDAPEVQDAVAKLEPVAASGVPRLEQLRSELGAVAEDIVQRSRAPDGDSVLDQAKRNLMGLVSVRAVGADAEGDDVDARVARAEARLADGDLAAAVAELEGLEGPAAEAAAGWLEQAKARLAAEQALASLQQQASDLLTR